MKKLLNILIMIGLIISLISCNGSDEPNIIEVSELKDVTVKILLPGDSEPKGFQSVLNEINYQLKLDGKPYDVSFTFLSETDYPQRLPLRVDDNFDAAFVHIENFDYYLSQKILRDAKPYLDEYGADILENTPDFAWRQVQRGDSYFAIPRNAPVSDAKKTLAVRKDWMDEFGMDKIETLAELETYFAKVYNKMSLTSTEFDYVYAADNHYEFLYREYAKGYFFPLINYAARPIFIDLTTKKDGKYIVENFYTSEAFINLIEKTRTYFTPLNYVPESELTNTTTLFYGNMLGGVWNTLLKTSERINEFKMYQPDGDIYDVYLNPDEPRYLAQGTENMMALLSKGKNPNETVDFLNWIRENQENHDLLSYGILGEHYNLTENGRLTFENIRPDKRYSDSMPYWAMNDFRFARWSEHLSDEYINKRLDWDYQENVIITDLVGFSVDLSSLEMQTLHANIKAVESAPATQLIDGRWNANEVLSNNMTRYEKLIFDLEDAGINRFIELIQQQLDKFLDQ